MFTTNLKRGAIVTAAMVAGGACFLSGLANYKTVRLHAAEDTERLKLVQVQVVARHCARTPVSRVPNEKEQNYRWTCPHYSSNTVVSQQALENDDPQLLQQEVPHLVPYRLRLMVREDQDEHGRGAGNCIRGQLTLNGIKNCYQLGQELREIYFNPRSVRYLGEEMDEFDPGKVFVRCTDIDTRRTEHSAIYMVC